MKHTDGLFHRVFEEVAAEYPDIESDHYIIDIGSALLADRPDQFDVVVTLNLYGDIVSDITAQVAGSVGLGGSANIGDQFAMFEAIHGSAPDIAGKDLANPSGLINAACMMLVHLGHTAVAEKIQNALLCTLEDGIHTADIYSEAYTHNRVGTGAFTQALIERLGRTPRQLPPVHYPLQARPISVETRPYQAVNKELVGVDVFLDWTGSDRSPEVLGKLLEELAGPGFQLKMITNRGVKVYPNGLPETFCTDHWRCRFVSQASKLYPGRKGMRHAASIGYQQVLQLLGRLSKHQLDIIKTENLYRIDGQRAYSLGQGE